MTDIAKKLEEYRKKKLQNVTTITSKGHDRELEEKLLKNVDLNISNSPEDTEEEIDDSIRCFSLIDLLYYGLCLILWIMLYAIFIKLQFGTVFFLVSCLVGIYINTRTRPKRKGEVSAYSVFNKDCKSIDGTLKAEQFEREIRYGPSSMH